MRVANRYMLSAVRADQSFAFDIGNISQSVIGECISAKQCALCRELVIDADRELIAPFRVTRCHQIVHSDPLPNEVGLWEILDELRADGIEPVTRDSISRKRLVVVERVADR